MVDVAALLCALHLGCSRIAQPAGYSNSLHSSFSLQVVGSVRDEGYCVEQVSQQCSELHELSESAEATLSQFQDLQKSNLLFSTSSSAHHPLQSIVTSARRTHTGIAVKQPVAAGVKR